MIDKVTQFIDTHGLIQPGSTIIVGLSGGPDSVCLLHILHGLQSRYQYKLIAAHLDHEWRSESAQDALFCKDYALSLGVEFKESKASTIIPAKKYNGSKEELGRNIRRTFFESLVSEVGASAIALGHHLDDQQETFFMRLIRGASIAGLSGMKPREKMYIRPFLGVYKREILEYLESNNLRYVQDITNNDETYLRNAIRHKVIPALRTSDSRFDGTFEKSHAHIRDTQEFLDRLAEKVFAEISEQTETGIWLNITHFLAADSFLHHGLLVRWLCTTGVPFVPSTAFFDEIIRFFKNKGERHEPHTGWIIEKKDGCASIKTTCF